jgi:hypothetical protein
MYDTMLPSIPRRPARMPYVETNVNGKYARLSWSRKDACMHEASTTMNFKLHSQLIE